MAHLIQGSDISQVWQQLVRDLIDHGKETSPRQKPTQEILNVTIEVEFGLRNIIVSNVRDLNYRFMIVEWLWIAGGLDDVGSLTPYNSIMKNYSDDGEILNGAYGPRLAPQWNFIVNRLLMEDSRQAVATIWTPSPKDSKDIPCTISLQFMVRGGKLHLTVNMRSSDVWLGLPYDYFSFSQLANMVAARIKIDVGPITMNLASSHIYKEDMAKGILTYQEYSYCHASPHLPQNKPLPNKSQTREIINHRQTVLGFPWNSYAKALTKNKEFALEVLRELSPI